MTEHPTKQDLDGYRRRVLTPAAFLSVHRHVIACPRCAEQPNSLQDQARDLSDLHSALLSAPDDTPYHLSEDEVVAYVRGALDEIDLEIAESHLSICAMCLTEVERRATEVQAIAPVSEKSPAFNPRRRVSLSLINWWQPWRVAAVVCCGIVIILVTLWLLQSKPVPHAEQAAGPASQSSPQSSPAEAQPSVTPEVLPDAQIALVLNDGNRKVTIDKQGTLAGLERLPSPLQQRIQAALQIGKLEHSPALAQLANPQSTLLGESNNGMPFGLIGPLGQVVRSEQPTFRWSGLAGAQSYIVSVTDADLNEIATSPPLRTTEWRIPKPLREGGMYSWQVTALKEGVKITSPVLPAPQAKFKIIERSTLQMLQHAQRAYPRSHLTLGVLYAEAGLLDDAERELRMLVRDNPHSGVAVKLLQNIQAMRTVQTSSSSRP